MFRMPGKITLEVAQGPIRGKVFVFEEHDTFIFGRARDCHARLSQDDTTASRHHFLLEVNPPEVWIRDLGSLNGTYINGKKFGGRREGETPQEAAHRKLPNLDLNDQDQITVGETVFVVRIQAPAFCCRCHKEIPEEFQSMCRWIEGAFICPQCREEVKNAGESVTKLEPIRCEHCGKDVSDEVSGGQQGDYICGNCRTEAKFNPVSVLVNVLMNQREEGQEEASLSNIAGYKIERMLGRGTLGAVYLAQRQDDSVKVALKIMLSRIVVDERSRQRFHHEIETLGELRHSNIVDLYEHGSAGSGFYFAMEYCSGGSVEDWMQKKGGRLSLEEAAWSVLQVLEGLSYAHQKGYVHRAIKPSNLLLTSQTKYTAKLVDFGLARSFERAGFSGMSAIASSISTAMFMPREQLTQFRLSHPVSDVWSLAASFYFMLTGRAVRDFPADKDPVEVILRGKLIPIRDMDSKIPKKVAKVIDKALSDDTKERYSDATEFLRALNKAL
jgi:hypothetical protein